MNKLWHHADCQRRFAPTLFISSESLFTSPEYAGRKLAPQFKGELGNRFNIRIEGTRIKHTMGPVSLKIYDKFGRILRLETTVNEVSFFQHYREVEHRDGTCETKWAPMRKTIYSLPALRELLAAANRRYLEFLSTLDDPGAGLDKINRVCKTVQQNDRSYPGFNFFDEDDQMLFEALARGEFNISGLRNQTLRSHLGHKSSGQVSRASSGASASTASSRRSAAPTSTTSPPWAKR